MTQIFLNNARAVLNAPITTTSTEVEITDSVGIPTSLRSGDWFLLTIYADSRQYGENHEVVCVTGINSNTLTVERGIEGEAKDHVMGERIEGRLTAGTLDVVEKTRKKMMMLNLGIKVL